MDQEQLRSRIVQERGRLYRIAYAWSCDALLAKKLAREAITRAEKQGCQLHEPERFESWLYAILHECWRGHLRRRKPGAVLDEEIIPCAQEGELPQPSGQAIGLVQSAVARLPLGQREVLTLVELNEFSYAQVAEVMELTVGGVTSRLLQGRDALRAVLSRLGVLFSS